ncbi:MAG: TetR family transcriptional regulator C-terminal domain-containing protein, partial [Mycobacterium sp.]
VFRPRLEAAFGRWVAQLGEGLHRMRDRGDLSADADPQRLAANVIAVLQGGMVLGRVGADITPMLDAADTARARLRCWRHDAAEEQSPTDQPTIPAHQ